jgi:4-amino-4-deoxy-L-arabinose transferase-like glycosyltransferase
MKRLPWSIVIAAILTAAYLIGLALNLSPWLRGPEEWRWAYAIPGTLSRLWLAVVVLIAYLIGAAWLIKRAPSRRTTLLVIVIAALMTPLLQLALLYMDHPDVKAPLFYRTVSASSGGYFNVGAVVTDLPDFLRHFVERMPAYPIHPQRHPPGLPWLFAVSRQIFEQAPDLTRSLSAALRAYQCQNIDLMNLPDSAIASATTQMIVPLLLGLVVWPLYALGRRLYDEPTARRAALAWPLIPSIALWATRWDQLFALFTVGAFLWLWYGLQRRRWRGLFFSGVIVSLGLFFNFSNIAIGAMLALFALLWLITQPSRPTLRWLVIAAVSWLVGLVTIWAALFGLYQFDPAAAWRTAMGIHLGLDRSYVTWLFYHPYDFLVFLGIPLAVFWCARTIESLRALRQRPRSIDLLALTFLIGFVLLIVSGTSRGEVARVWAFLLPLPLLIAARYKPDRSGVFVALLILVAAQTLISSVFLRTVGTGLSDPPAPPLAVTLSPSPRAQWQAGMSLNSIDFPNAIGRSEPLDITATWSAQQPILRPYTLFIHLLDAQGQLVAQSDDMALNGTWPTTCWQPQYAFTDQYRLTLPADIAPGDYRLSLGFYWLPTLERAAVLNEGDQFEAGTITVR